MRDRIILWILLIVLALIYVPVLLWVWQSPKAKELGLELRGPIVVYKTQRGKNAMDRIGSHRKFCRILASFSNIVAIILMGVMMVFLIMSVVGIPSKILGTTGTVSITGLGMNYIQFIIFGVIALFVSMIIHEFAHGTQSRANDVRVESSGLMYAVVPLGAFVEMNEEDSDKATLKQKMSIYSAGISANFIVAVISFLVFSVLLLAPLSNVDGVEDNSAGVYSLVNGSPAQLAGLSVGSVILTIDGEEVCLDENISGKIISDGAVGGGIFTVEYKTPNGTASKEMWLGVYVSGTVSGSPAQLAGLPKDSIIQTINGKSITDLASFYDVLGDLSTGDKIEMTYTDLSKNTADEIEFNLGNNNGKAYMGVYLTYSGMQMVTPGHVLGVASNPMYNTTTISGALSSALTYPFRGMEGYSPVPEEFQWWFDAPGGNLFWGGAVLMYWMFWVNLLLGITNALPLIPFDGGYLFRGWVTQLLEKIRYKDEKAREEAAKNIASAVSGVMAFLLILIVFVVLWY